MPRKQRHTARRVYNRLQEQYKDGFACSYRLVADYVARRKKELRLIRQDAYIPLIHHPGEAQADFGTADFILEGLEAVFEHIGGVPAEIWFDNTKTIVTEIIKGGGRHVTERFQLFCEHYRFKAVFMNPESGWEKGNVENKVGYLSIQRVT